MLKEKKPIAEDIKRFLPDYIIKPVKTEYTFFQLLIFGTICAISKVLICLFLRPHGKKISRLGEKDVDNIYSQEASGYDKKHHLTTYGADLSWRRMAGWLLTVINRNNNQKEKIKVLDICTGTGLTIKEMVNVSKEWGFESEFIGLDYNAAMVRIAQERFSSK